MDTDNTAASSVVWKEVILYYVIAVAVSAPFRLGWVDLSTIMPLPMGFSIIYRVLGGLGPAVGFFVLIYLVRTKIPRNVSLFGTSKSYSLLAVSVIPLVLAVVGWENSFGLNAHWNGFLVGITFTVYALGEELGWRGYLQHALAPLPLPGRITLIASLWYLWHLNFLKPHPDPEGNVVQFGALVAGSWALLMITNRTHSLLMATAVHLSFNIIGEFDGSLEKRLIVLGISAVVWAFAIRRMARLPYPPAS